MKNLKSQFLLHALLLVLLSSNLFSQPLTGLVKVIVAPDHKDWIYKTGEQAKFTVEVLKYGNPIDNVKVNYEVGPEMFPEEVKEGVVWKNGTAEFTGTMKKPGFYRVRVVAVVDGRRYEGMATAAFDPEKIEPTAKMAEDFDSYWQNAIAEARKVSLDPRMSLMPERCTNETYVYHVNFQNNVAGSRIYGILAIPKKEGRYPAILTVPGAGVRPYAGDMTNAAKGIITLEIGIHGIPVNMDPSIYSSLYTGGLQFYWYLRLNNKDEYVYKKIYLACVRAVDFIFSLPEFNGTDIAVTGGSQGGALTIVTAGLDKRVKYLAAVYPAMCDHTGYLYKRAGGWPHYFRNEVPKEGELETLAYYDVVNFAKKITVPGLYTWGFNDLTCPPTSMYSAYNSIKAPKEILLFQETGHWKFPEETDAVNEWLIKRLIH